MKIVAKDCFGSFTVMEGNGDFIEHWVFKNGAVMKRVVHPKHIVPLTHVPGADRASVEAARAWMKAKSKGKDKRWYTTARRTRKNT